jgi:hypothetical protein
VKPYLTFSIVIIYSIVGIYILSNYLYANKGLVGIALITNSIFIGLGQYLEFYVPLASFVTNILGALLSFFSIIVFYYWKEGQRHVQVRVKNERAEDIIKKNKPSSIKIGYQLLKRQRQLVKDKGYSQLLAFQFAYVEYHEDQIKKEEKNAIDFILGREVILQRNEYDQSPNK